MSDETFTSGPNSYKVAVYPAPVDGKKHPMVLLLHGNFGLVAPYGDQIRTFAKSLAGLGYVTAVPQYYNDDNPRPDDNRPDPHVPTLSAAIQKVAGRAGADADRLGLIGFSLGAATAMTYIVTNPPGRVKVFADFFGFLTPAIRAGVGSFPPTIIFHNGDDHIVGVQNSVELDRLLPPTIKHQFVPPYTEQWQEINHAFQPDGHADLDSRKKTQDWFITHLPPTGR
jgi:dienelactone hydrolase